MTVEKNIARQYLVWVLWAMVSLSMLCRSPHLLANDALAHSNLKPDEHVVLFRSAAHLNQDGTQWQIPINAWVHEIDARKFQKWTLRRLLDGIYDIEIEDHQEDNFERSTDLLFADSESGKRVVVEIAGESFTLPETGFNGLASKIVTLPVAALRQTDPDFFTVKVKMPPEDEREFEGIVLKEDAGSRVVISDFDDTVKITGAMNKKTLYESTFTKDYTAVDGMAQVYRDWADEHWLFHFVSSSPEQLYPLLDEFLEAQSFPPAVLHLKSFRFFDSTVGNLVRSAVVTKPPAIEAIMEACQGCQFVLIGDSGQEDPEVYTKILKDFEHRVLAVGIHNVNGDSLDDPRYQELIEVLGDDRFILFSDPASIRHFGALGHNAATARLPSTQATLEQQPQ